METQLQYRQCKMGFQDQTNADGSILKFKASLVANQRIDFNETFNPVVESQTICV